VGGGFLVVGFLALTTVDTEAFRPTGRQVAVLVYLGVVASGLGFYGWNRGAAIVTNPGVLAVFNNLKIPLGVLVALVFFGESAESWRLAGGSVLILVALALSLKKGRQDSGTPV